MRKPHFLIISLVFLISSCASLRSLIHRPEMFGDSPTDLEEPSDATLDPVAAMAMKFRSPASANLPAEPNPRLLSAVQTHDLALRMSQAEVLRSWGEPREVQTVGAPETGFERWVYYEGLSSPWSLRNSRVIYFDQGQVSGWETLLAD